MSGEIGARVAEVNERIALACRRAGRSETSVTLVAVTKNVSAERVREALAAGVTHIGENRVQEAQDKFPHLPQGVTRHMIGHLQTNKVRPTLELFEWLHSIDRLRLARAVANRAQDSGRMLNCLVQVNVADEESKFGVGYDEAMGLISEVGKLPGIGVRGLMTIAPYQASERELRRVFGGLRTLAERVGAEGLPGVSMEHLSMGMSGDYELAVEEGATMVRVGSSIFGPRE